MTDVVVITGASAGIGRATAVEFGRRGARVALLARNHERLRQASEEVIRAGGEALVVSVDVSDSDQLEDAARHVEQAFGPIDIWVNNAAEMVFSPVKDMTPAEYKRVTEVTYLGYVNGTLTALRRMLARNKGTIVQVGSGLAYRAIPLVSAYCGAKFAIRGFTDALRAELAHDQSQVKVAAVMLSGIDTPIYEWSRSHMDHKVQPISPFYQPESAAASIVSVAYRPRREVWVGLPSIAAILGAKLLPGFTDFVASRLGYRLQLMKRPTSPERPTNLYRSADGDFGSHGSFEPGPIEKHLDPIETTYKQVTFYGLAALTAGVLGVFWHRRHRALDNTLWTSLTGRRSTTGDKERAYGPCFRLHHNALLGRGKGIAGSCRENRKNPRQGRRKRNGAGIVQVPQNTRTRKEKGRRVAA
jgi:short-subunit dehydrogenase